MGKVKTILKYIASLFLVLLVSLCIYTFVVTDLMKKDYANVFGYTYFVVATGSMSGTIEVNDIIFVKITKDAKVNDIITFKNKDGSLITHRLVSKNGDKYITKGDVNNVSDEEINKSQMVGRVVNVVSPSFIIKSIAIFLIVFILLALFNFDQIIEKYILKEQRKSAKLPNDLFSNPNRIEEPSTGLTVTISLDEMEKIKDSNEEEADNVEATQEIEVLSFDDYMVEEPVKKKKRDTKEKETVDLVVSILKCKKNHVAKARMNKKWLTKYQYVYKLCQLLVNDNSIKLTEEINNPPFKEIYDYDLDRVGLTETIRNKIYDMPIYVFLRLLTYAILYNDDEMFDGIYKILKYKVQIDKDNKFKQISKNDKTASKQLHTLIEFMKKVSNRFDNKNVFELDKIERMVRIGNY